MSRYIEDAVKTRLGRCYAEAAAAGAPALVTAVTTTAGRSPAWQADVWRAAGKAAAGASPDVQRAAATAMLAALEAADDHERRVRLVVAVAPLVAGDEVTRLRRWLSAHDASASDRGVRRLATAGLARNPHADARLAVIDLALPAQSSDAIAKLDADKPLKLEIVIRPDSLEVGDRHGGNLLPIGDRIPDVATAAGIAAGVRTTGLRRDTCIAGPAHRPRPGWRPIGRTHAEPATSSSSRCSASANGDETGTTATRPAVST